MPKWYIDANALIDYACNQKDKTITPNDIARFPKADVQEVKHAHWIISRVYWNGGSEIAEVYCSRCKNNPSLKKPDCILPNYCDNCGSYMARNKDDLEKEKDNAEIH